MCVCFGWSKVSGVLAVVIGGLYMSFYGRPRISPSVQVYAVSSSHPGGPEGGGGGIPRFEGFVATIIAFSGYHQKHS